MRKKQGQFFKLHSKAQLSVFQQFQKNGGDEGIRTLDGLMTHTPLAGERLRPLGHVSVGASSDVEPRPQVIF